jgi:hypothetical protein
MLFRRENEIEIEIEIDEIVKHCFLVLFIEFTDCERIAGFVVCLICFQLLSEHSGSGEIILTSIQI